MSVCTHGVSTNGNKDTRGNSNINNKRHYAIDPTAAARAQCCVPAAKGGKRDFYCDVKIIRKWSGSICEITESPNGPHIHGAYMDIIVEQLHCFAWGCCVFPFLCAVGGRSA